MILRCFYKKLLGGCKKRKFFTAPFFEKYLRKKMSAVDILMKKCYNFNYVFIFFFGNPKINIKIHKPYSKKHRIKK